VSTIVMLPGVTFTMLQLEIRICRHTCLNFALNVLHDILVRCVGLQ